MSGVSRRLQLFAAVRASAATFCNNFANTVCGSRNHRNSAQDNDDSKMKRLRAPRVGTRRTEWTTICSQQQCSARSVLRSLAPSQHLYDINPPLPVFCRLLLRLLLLLLAYVAHPKEHPIRRVAGLEADVLPFAQRHRLLQELHRLAPAARALGLQGARSPGLSARAGESPSCTGETGRLRQERTAPHAAACAG